MRLWKRHGEETVSLFLYHNIQIRLTYIDYLYIIAIEYIDNLHIREERPGCR